jgi:hypothetical protein
LKHFLLKFNHGVEIGAYLAYIGHYRRTLDVRVQAIAQDEIEHRSELVAFLKYYGECPNPVIDFCFTVVGTIIQKACHFSPRFALNFVARSMELFAVFNYDHLATIYPEFEYSFRHMSATEKRHATYFNSSKKDN